MSSEETSPERRIDASDSHKSGCTFHYTIPQWFMKNIQSRDELRASNINIWLRNESSSGIDDSSVTTQPSSDWEPAKSTIDENSHCFHIDKTNSDLLLDIVASLQTPDRIGRLSPSRSSVELCCNMRFGLGFLDELVVLIARELNSSLVSINSQDLEDLGLDFYYQDLLVQKIGVAGTSDDAGGPCGGDCGSSTARNAELEDDDNYDTSQIAKRSSRCYFGDCDEHHATRQDDKRSSDAFCAIVNAVKSKNRQPEGIVIPQNTTQSSYNEAATRSSPIILYFRDGLASLTPTRQSPDSHPSSPMIASDAGHRRGSRIQDMIRQHRKSGDNISMIFARTHTDVDEVDLDPDPHIPWKISRCDCQLCSHNDSSRRADSKLDKFVVLPLSVPRSWAPEREAQSQRSVTATRIQSFKRRLSAQLSQFASSPAELLQPQCDWLSLLPGNITNHFASLSFSTEIGAAFNRIVSRCSRKGRVELNDLRAIFLQMSDSIALKSAKENDSVRKDGSADLGNLSEGAEEGERSQAELHNPSYLVQNADHLNANFDITVFDQAALARIKTLAQLWRAENQETSSSFATQTKSQSIVLYGAPGTGKTLLVQAIAKTMEFRVIKVNKQILRNASVQAAKDSIRAIFDSAKRKHPCIILIDDVEILLKNTQSSWEYVITTELFHCLDVLKKESSSSFMLATTNVPRVVNAKFLRHSHQILMRLPDAQARIRIISLFLKQDILAGTDVNQLKTATEGFSVAELQDLSSQTKFAWAIERGQIPGQESPETTIPLTDQHFSEALKYVRPYATAAYLNTLEEYSREYGPTTGDAYQNDAWAAFDLRIQRAIQFINSKEPEDSDDPFFWEKRFLSLIVNPKDMQTSWSDLAVSTEIEQEIKRVINHHHQISGATTPQSYGLLRLDTRGALLYGPPGTGKTHLARALAHDRDMVSICATAADINNRYHGDGEKAIKGLFNLGKLLAPSIVFIDEADSLFSKREDLQYQYQRAEVNQFLHEMDGLSSSERDPFVLLATNHPAMLDSAVLRRVPNMFYFGLPSYGLRQRIFEILLREEIVDPAVSIPLLAAQTSRYTGSDIRSLCVRAALSCDEFVEEEGKDKGKRRLTMRMFQEAWHRTGPTATKAAVSSIREFAKENHPLGIEQMQAFEFGELEAQKVVALAEKEKVEKAEVPAKSSLNLGHESGDPHSALVLSSNPRSIPQLENIQATSTTEMVSLSTVSALNEEAAIPAGLYDPIPEGSKKIRVLSIAPIECPTSETLISCTLDQVDLEDWTAEYRSFRAMLPVFGEDLRLVENRLLHLLWIDYNEDPNLVQRFIKDELHLSAAYIDLQLFCDQPMEKFRSLRDRFSWGDYIALSYVWGDQTEKKKILLNDKPFEVGLNLYEALKRLSTSYEIRSRGLKVWIDAICINQEDVGEREVEVRKMDLIYSRAQAVRGWLGHPTDEFAADLSDFRSTLDVVSLVVEEKYHDIGCWKIGFSKYQENAEGVLNVMCLDNDKLFSMWSSIDGMSGVPYWNRLWITQEIALASSILFWYGGCYVTPTELRALRPWCQKNKSIRKLDTYIDQYRMLLIMYNLKTVEDMLSWTREPNDGSVPGDGRQDKLLMKCISHAAYSRATDPRDKVYGILALLPPTMSSRIRPNYSPNFTWRDTWMEFTRVLFQHQCNLNLLAKVDRFALPFRNGMPSWALSFETRESQENVVASQADVLDLGNQMQRLLVHHGASKVIFSAHNQQLVEKCSSDAGFQPSFTFSMDDRLLFCTCVFVDQVSHISQAPAKLLELAPEVPHDTGVVQMRTSYGRPCPDPKLSLSRATMGKKSFQWKDGPSIFDIPWFGPEQLERIPKTPRDLEITPKIRLNNDRSGVTDVKFSRNEIEGTNNISWAQIFSQENSLRGLFQEILHPNARFPLRGTSLREYFTSEHDVCGNWSSMADMVSKSSYVLAFNPICETRSGLVGWVSSLAQPGDSIAVIFGCDMPLVLRPRAGQYEVIGGCFIDGLMNGEVKDEVTSGRLVPEKIDLC